MSGHAGSRRTSRTCAASGRGTRWICSRRNVPLSLRTEGPSPPRSATPPVGACWGLPLEPGEAALLRVLVEPLLQGPEGLRAAGEKDVAEALEVGAQATKSGGG